MSQLSTVHPVSGPEPLDLLDTEGRPFSNSYIDDQMARLYESFRHKVEQSTFDSITKATTEIVVREFKNSHSNGHSTPEALSAMSSFVETDTRAPAGGELNNRTAWLHTQQEQWIPPVTYYDSVLKSSYPPSAIFSYEPSMCPSLLPSLLPSKQNSMEEAISELFEERISESPEQPHGQVSNRGYEFTGMDYKLVPPPAPHSMAHHTSTAPPLQPHFADGFNAMPPVMAPIIPRPLYQPIYKTGWKDVAAEEWETMTADIIAPSKPSIVLSIHVHVVKNLRDGLNGTYTPQTNYGYYSRKAKENKPAVLGIENLLAGLGLAVISEAYPEDMEGSHPRDIAPPKYNEKKKKKINDRRVLVFGDNPESLMAFVLVVNHIMRQHYTCMRINSKNRSSGDEKNKSLNNYARATMKFIYDIRNRAIDADLRAIECTAVPPHAEGSPPTTPGAYSLASKSLVEAESVYHRSLKIIKDRSYLTRDEITGGRRGKRVPFYTGRAPYDELLKVFVATPEPEYPPALTNTCGVVSSVSHDPTASVRAIVSQMRILLRFT